MILHQNRQALAKGGIAVWGPERTRTGLMSGLLKSTRLNAPEVLAQQARNCGLIAVEMARLKQAGTRQLLVSEENMLGSLRGNFKVSMLYPGARQRLARIAQAFGGDCRRIGLSIRPYHDYWASALAHAIPRGLAAPGEEDLDRLVTQPRSWRRVIEDVVAAFPGVDIAVWEFDRLKARPQAQLRLLTGAGGCLAPALVHANAAPDRAELRQALLDRGKLAAAALVPAGRGPYQPFAAHHMDALQAQYHSDLAWLRQCTSARIRFDEQVEQAAPAIPAPARKRGTA
ncbi:MAG: hypothetical protein K8F59_16195 [Rhodobacteraceae bacterium]|nr:hypothetical protein [Paracoccaceae bacterium]